ncbi:hypothetical protein [Undibacterium sp. WLX3042]|uniref:hypothetical protein n=1 Tax=Undibacterium sp. WLX3042 TaxID=3412686 RepID=UPI003C2B7CE5
MTGKLQVVGGVERKNHDVDSSSGFISSIDSLPEKYKLDFEFKIKLIKWLQKCGVSRGRRKLVDENIKKFFELHPDIKVKRPSASAVMGWMREWEISNNNPACLISKNFQRKRVTNLSDFIEQEVQKVLKEEYFVRSRPSLERAHTMLERRLQMFRSKEQRDEKIPEVSISSLRRRVQEVDPYIRDTLRYGAFYAKNKWRYSLHGNYTNRALQRLEIDHTILDLVVIADASGMPLGRPVITIIVDSFSGYLVGFYISFAGAGLAAVLNCMKVGLMPKNTFTDHVNFLKNPWLGYGVGEMYVVDNGLEFHSKQFVNAALELNTDIQYCPVRQPWFKPSVEHFFRELGFNLPAEGNVQKPLANYLPINPAESARISFSELCNGLLKYFVDVYPTKINSKTLEIPFDLFKESFESTPPPLLPTNLQSLGLIAAHQKTLSVGNEGIVTNYLRFNSHDLQSMRRKISPSFKTTIKYDPEDLGYCYVQNPVDLTWLYVPNCHPEYANNLSMLQHKAIRDRLKQSAIQGDKYESHLRAKLEFIELWESITKGRKVTKDIKSALRFGDLTSTKSLSVPEVVELKNKNDQLFTKDEMKSEETSIPSFSSYFMD